MGSQIPATRDKEDNTRDAQQQVDIRIRINDSRHKRKASTVRDGDLHFPDIGTPDEKHTVTVGGKRGPRGASYSTGLYYHIKTLCYQP